jgi:nucleoside-diphosphate-sugar epimerase
VLEKKGLNYTWGKTSNSLTICPRNPTPINCNAIKKGVMMSKNFSRILVTGGAGFIGSHLVDRLLAENYEVTVFDNFSTGTLRNISHNENKKLKILRGDVRKFDEVNAAMKDVDAVFHEAAMVSITVSIQDPILANDINVNGTLNVLKASADLGVKRLVFASSAAVYGPSSGPCKKEVTSAFPANPYGVTKLVGENYVRSFSHSYGLETVSLRYFNVYGSRQSFDIDNAYGGVITLFLNRLLRNIPPVIYGDGQQTRDFVYIQDVVQANMLALESKNASGEFFNIGSGTVTSVNEVAQTLKDLLNKGHLSNVYAEHRLGDEKHGFADISKAKTMLHYEPHFSFKEGIVNLINWYTTNPRC